MLLKREEVLGKNVLAATDYYTPDDVVKTLQEAKGKEVVFWQTDKETYKGFLTGAGMPEFAAQELYENMMFMDEFGYFKKQSLDWSHSVSLIRALDRKKGEMLIDSLQLLDEKPTTLADFFGKSKAWDA